MDKKNNKKMAEPLAAKHRARKRIIQALYQTHFNHMAATEVIEQFLEEQDFAKVDVDFFREVMLGVEKNKTELQEMIDPYLGREKVSLGAIEYAALLLATYELVNHIETPFKVIINEAILMTQAFGGEGSHTFVNGVLYKIAQQTRATEMGEAP
ncbi:transcription antitermination factor NusB [Marinicella sp. W31]|uniref:transcription antitermination factor NusB n=1 Tax=Marinicella sp. W31 TaxID=3023713 RepID=UPI003757639F